MNTIQRFYNRAFGDYGVMQCCRSYTDQELEFVSREERTKEDWDELHRVWTLEPLPEENEND